VYDDVRLRNVENADLEAFFEHQRDPDSTRLTASVPRARKPFFAYWAEIRSSPTVFAQTIVVDREVVGNIMCWEQSGEHWVGYGIARRHWGRGVATTALALFLCQVSWRPLHAFVAVHNAGSMRVLEKCGFQRVGDGDSSTGGSGEITLVEHILES
jgi:RimJ/RimL family protein N-acetyltransferase